MNTNTDAPVYDKAVFTYNGNFYQHGSAAEHATQGAHPSSFTQTTSAQFTPHEPQAYQASGAIDDLTSHNSIDNLDAARGEMVRLFEGASPTTQNFVLHFLRKSTGNIQNREVSNSATFTACASDFGQPQPMVYNTSYDGSNLGQPSLSSENIGVTSSSTYGFPQIHPQMQDRQSNLPTNILSTPHPNTRPNSLPNFTGEHENLAKKPYDSAPGPSTEPHIYHQPMVTIGGSVMNSQSSLYFCEYGCGQHFKQKDGRKRHQEGACVLSQQKINYTCLLHECIPACERSMCRDQSHRLDFKGRVDKMRHHLITELGLNNFTQGDIPLAWKWPVKRSTLTRGWTCELCDQDLKTWRDNQQEFIRHCLTCPNGTEARAARYPVKQGGVSMEVQLNKGLGFPSKNHLKKSRYQYRHVDDEAGDEDMSFGG